MNEKIKTGIIGANIGIYSLYASRICAEVLSFEPVKSNLESLRKNLKKKIEEFLWKDFKVKKFNNPYGKIGVNQKILEELR